MSSPFPGMDPYLENADLWSGFHAPFLVALQNRLAPLVRPKYFVRVEERVYLSDEEDPGRRVVPDVRVVAFEQRPWRRPQPNPGGGVIAVSVPVVEQRDEEVHEHYLEVRDRVDRSVVTVVELLSPSNKIPGSRGRTAFVQKRREVYATDTHWVEIDLLRGGTRTCNNAPAAGTPYQVFLSRARGGGERGGSVWPIALEAPLPVIGIPLRGADADVPLDLQAAFDFVYDTGAYDVDLEDDYAADPPPPPLSPDTLAWCRARVAARRASASD